MATVMISRNLPRAARPIGVSKFVALLLALAIPGISPAQVPIQREAATVTVQFPNAPVDVILPFYQKLTGKRLIKDANLTGGMLSIYSAEKMTRRDAISYIETALLMNGYAVIPAGPDTVKVVNNGGGQNPRAEGLPVIVRKDQLPEHDKVVNYIMHLDHISPDQAQRTFTQAVQLHTYGAITPMTNASGVIITENSSTIRSLIELKEYIDVPPARVTKELIQLRRADAKRVAEIINSIYEAEENSTGIVESPPQTDPDTPPIQNVAAVNTNPTAARVRVFPDELSNRLLVIGRPVDIAYVKSIAHDFDMPVTDVNQFEHRLRYLAVQDFLPIAEDALRRVTDFEGGDGSPNGGRADANSVFPVSNANTNTGNTRDRVGGGDLLGDAQKAAAPMSAVVGRTHLVADSQANTLLVFGSPEHIDLVKKIIDKMDKRPPQVYISAVIGQLTLGDNLEYGLDLVAALDTYSAFGTNVRAAAGLLTNSRVPDLDTLDVATGFPDLSGLSLYGQIGSLSAVFKLAAEDQNFKILSRPSVYTTNRSKATISSGTKIPVPVSTLTSLDNPRGSVASNVEFRDVVLKFEVIPLINSDHEVTLQIAQLNDNIIGTQTVGTSEIPTISTQELNTTVTVKNGQTIVLGGLITEREIKSNKGIPILRRIPLIRAVTSTTKIDVTREELLVFIQPHIIRPEDDVSKPNQLEFDRSVFTGEALQFADPRPPVKAIPVVPQRAMIVPQPVHPRR